MSYGTTIGLLSVLILTFYSMNHFIIHLSFSNKIWKVSGIVFLISTLILISSTYNLVSNGKLSMLHVSITGLIIGVILFVMAGVKLASTSGTSRNKGFIYILIGSLIFAGSATHLTQNYSKLFAVFYIPISIILLFSLLILIGESIWARRRAKVFKKI